jgi:acetyl esterase
MPDSSALLDPALAAIARNMPPAVRSSIFDTPLEARRGFEAAVADARRRMTLPVVGRIEDAVVRHDRATVPIRVYRPGTPPPHPTLLFLHGGGFVLGGIEQMDDIARRICRDVDSVLVSAGYRLAPEAPFPAAFDDAVNVAAWVVKRAAQLGGGAKRVGLVGESAGGNLAASAALVLAARGISLAAQLLVVPGVDLSLGPEAGEFPMLTGRDLQAIAKCYLGPAGIAANRFPPSPLYAEDLRGLPATVIGVAGHDPLAQSIEAFARRLEEARVPLHLHKFADMFHPFFGFTEASPAAARACATLMQSLARTLESAARPPTRA